MTSASVPHPPAIDPYSPYRDELLPTARVRALSELRPWRVVADVLVLWGGIAAAWAAVILWPRWWVVTGAVAVITTRYYGLFIIGHDGMHKRVMPGAFANDLFCDLFLFGPVGAVVRVNSGNHLMHHRFLASERDPDRHKHSCFGRATPAAFLLFLTGIQGVYRTALNALRPGVLPEAAGLEHRRIRDVAIIVLWQLTLLFGLGWSIGWWAYIVLWWFPVYLAMLCDLIRAFAEHSHPEADRVADVHRLVTYTSHPVERLFLAPMNMNYHAVHHLWTSIPYYNLSTADREIRGHPAAGGLIWRGTYLAYLFRYFQALPLAECQGRAPIGE
jgi:fatty acid desaturase